MLKIRLQRVGRKNDPVFRVVVTESQNGPRSGRALEVIGNYDPRRGEKATIDTEKVKYWMSQGAQASGTIHNILVERKIVDGKKVNVLPKKKPIKKEEDKPKEAVAEAPKKEEPKTEEAPK